jgi:hypothetical protein
VGRGPGRPDGKLARPDVFHPRIVLAGCARLIEGDGDDDGLVAALRGRGLHARWMSWDDAEALAADLVILRTTRDYPDRLDEFLTWTKTVRHLLNAPNVVAWNADQRYLLDLARRGVPTAPTAVFAPGQPVRLAPASDVVVKPRGGAGARRFTDPAAAEAYITQLHEDGRSAVVQTYDGPVEETALVFLAGRQSHAFGGRGQADPDFEVWDVGVLALQAAAGHLGIDVSELLYARADIIGDRGDPRLLQLNLVDPSLGWRQLEPETRSLQQREFTLAVESALERLGLGPFSHRRP